MIPVFTAANAFIGISFYKKKPINAARLQQLLYLANKFYIETERSVMFAERFVTGLGGPALQSIEYMFPDKEKPIKGFVLQSDGNKPSMDSIKSEGSAAQIVVRAWEFCDNKSVNEVTAILTGRESGWANCLSTNRHIMSEADIVNERIA